MRYAIITRYYPGTDSTAAHITARTAPTTAGKTRKLDVDWDDALGADQNHAAAARALAVLLSWSGQWDQGAMAPNDRDAYVFVNRHHDRPAFEF